MWVETYKEDSLKRGWSKTGRSSYDGWLAEVDGSVQVVGVGECPLLTVAATGENSARPTLLRIPDSLQPRQTLRHSHTPLTIVPDNHRDGVDWKKLVLHVNYTFVSSMHDKHPSHREDACFVAGAHV